jgi:hypothetical protein
MTSLFERLTTLTPDDLTSHALSISATEYGLEAEDPTVRADRFEVAHQLRRLEETQIHDGAVVPALDQLRLAVDVPGVSDDGQTMAHHAFRAAINRMVADLHA